MKKVIVYCHGYASSNKTDKVFRLKKMLPDCEVHAWNIAVDPSVSIPYLTGKIDIEILASGSLEEEIKLIFVGTSLGGWYASKLADIYRAEAIIINPAYDPKVGLEKYGVDQEILNKYNEIKWNARYAYFISRNDEVIPFDLVAINLWEVRAKYYENTDHRFNGPEFDDVIEFIRKM
jgi:predicted esterase YcpF (UPF0227 family)